MAHLYQTDGRVSKIQPCGDFWSIEELQSLVGGMIEVVRTVDGRWMVIDEEGKLKGKELNIPATRLYIHGRRDVIVGAAVVVDTMLELDGPEP